MQLTGVRSIQASKDRAQRGFARPVLAQESMDFTALEKEVDIVVGLDTVELLVNADHLGCKRDSGV